MSVYRRLQFSAYCHTQFGQYVCICGNIPELGYWNPMKGLRLRTEQSYYPIWKSFDSIFVLQNQPIEFKIVLINSKNQYRWQNTMQNRIIVPQIDAYIQLTVNEFEAYEIFPFCDGDDAVRTGMNILNDLSSDGSSSISFKSNYKFYEYFERNHKKNHQSSIKFRNTSTFRDLTEFEGSANNNQHEFVTFIDSLMDQQERQMNFNNQNFTVTQDCTYKQLEEADSHVKSSNKLNFDEQTWINDDWIVNCVDTEIPSKSQINPIKKVFPSNRLASHNKIFYSNSSESLSLKKKV